MLRKSNFKIDALMGQIRAKRKKQTYQIPSYSKPKLEKGKPKRRKSEKKTAREVVENVDPPTADKFETSPWASNNNHRMGYATMTDIYDYFGNIKWSWKNYIPSGHLTMIAGVQGQGKSYLAAYILAVLTGTKRTWPDGTIYLERTGRVMLIDTEQMRGEYVVRLKSMGVPDDKVIFPISHVEGGDLTYTVDLISEFPEIEELALRKKCVGIVVDSLTGGHNINENSSEMKRILQPLSEMAAQLQLPFLVIHDLRKRSHIESSRATLDRVRGSVVITKFCRSVIGLYRPSENPNSPVRIDMLKTNFVKMPKSLGFSIDNQGLTFCDAPEVKKPITASDVASEFLMLHLANGPVKIKTITSQAKEEGITIYALYEAKRRLEVVTISGKWMLRTIDGKPYPVSKRVLRKDGADEGA